jgi:hypothetical protein
MSVKITYRNSFSEDEHSIKELQLACHEER